MSIAVHYSSRTDDWETPRALFAELHSEFRFGLDVCASASNKKCRRFFSKEVDGLKQVWRVFPDDGKAAWMNPPYGREIGKWIRKAAEATCTVVALVPARTDTEWWHNYIQGKAEVRFIRGRLRFGKATQNAPFPSAVVIWRKPLKE